MAPRKGNYENMPANKDCIVRIYDCPEQESLKLNGKNMETSYNPVSQILEITIPKVDCSKGFKLKIEYK